VAESSRSRPVRALAGVAAVTVVLASGLPPLTPTELDWIGPAVGLVGLCITAGLVPWTENRVTPTGAVEARILPALEPGGAPRIVAGEGSAIPTGAPVVVEATEPTHWTG